MRCLAAVILLCAVFAPVGCRKEEKPPEPVAIPVKVEAVSTQQIRPVWRYSGDIRPDTEVDLAFKQSGYVVALHQVQGADRRRRNVQVGDEVAAGTVLAQVRRSDNQAALTQAVGQQRSSEASVEASRAQLDQASVDEIKAGLDFDRAKGLYGAKAMTKPDYDAAEANYKAAAAKLDEAKRNIKGREAQVQTSLAGVAAAEINLGDTNLVAPMASTILSKMVDPGTLVSVGTAGFKVADMRTVKLQFGVPGTMVDRFRLSASFPVEIEALKGRTLKGAITQIAASANQDSRSFDIQVSLPNRDRSLRAGMIASVRVEQPGDLQTVPVVPVAALSTAQSGSTSFSIFVIREENGKQYARLRSVRIGETIGRSVAITQGLTPGERIIVNRPNQLVDGGLVRATN